MNHSLTTIVKYSLILLIPTVVILTIFLMTATVFDKSNSTIGIVDLDKVATAMGRTDVLSSTLNKSRAGEKEKRENSRKILLIKIEKMKKEIGLNPTKEQSADYKKIMREANRQLQPTAVEMENLTEESKVILLREFREQVRPIIKQVAKEKNLLLIEIKSANTIYINSKIDISDDVIAKVLRLQSKGDNSK